MRKLLAPIIAGGLAVGGLAVAAAPSSAAGLPTTCDLVGGLSFEDGADGAELAIDVAGSCRTPLDGSTVARIQGSGAADSLGLCDASGLMQNASIPVTMTEHNFLTGAKKVTPLTLSAAATTFPVATALQITDADGATVGGALLSTRIFVQCDAAGNGNTTMQVVLAD